MKLSRRHALRMIGGAAPSLASRGAFGQSPSQTTSASLRTNGFNTFTEDYAQFCATPADQRIFYDILYFDNPLFPLGWAGMNIGAYFYNHYLQTHRGKMEAIINIKTVPDGHAKAVVADYERGITERIMPYAWQSETCIGSWHYDRSLFEKPGEFGGYLQPRDAIHWLIDTVSKNGTLVLDIPGPPVRLRHPDPAARHPNHACERSPPGRLPRHAPRPAHTHLLGFRLSSRHHVHFPRVLAAVFESSLRTRLDPVHRASSGPV